MATVAFEEIVEDFSFLDDWEDRYATVIDLGKKMNPFRASISPARSCSMSLLAGSGTAWTAVSC